MTLSADDMLHSAKQLQNCREVEIQAQTHHRYVDIQITFKSDATMEHDADFSAKMAAPQKIIASHGGVFEVQYASGAPIAVRFTLRRADATATDTAPPEDKPRISP
jgi:hypothetical protein